MLSPVEYTALIRVPDSNKAFFDAMQADAHVPGERGILKIRHEDGCTILDITAKDPVALRALLNSGAKHVAVHSQMMQVSGNE